MIRLTPQGRVEIATIAGPSGQGYETTFALVLSRALGIPYEDIDVTNSDPGNHRPGGPKLTGMGTGGSRAAQIYGNAVHQGAQGQAGEAEAEVPQGFRRRPPSNAR